MRVVSKKLKISAVSNTFVSERGEEKLGKLEYLRRKAEKERDKF